MTSREQYPWLQQSRTLLIDAYWPPLNPALEFDAKQLIQTALKVNANAIRFGTMGKYALIPNPFIPLHPELGSRDLLQETIEAAKGTDIKIIAYASVGHGLPRSLLLEQRPEWQFIMDDGSLQAGVRHFGGELVSPVCSFGKYRNDITSFIKLLVDNYDINGLYLDGPYYNWNMGTIEAVCQCKDCKKMFLHDTGEKLPENKDFAKTDLKNIFADWVGRKLYELFNDIVGIAKENKALPVMFNAIAAAARPPEWEEKILSLSDGFLLEADLDGLRGLGVGNYMNNIIGRYTQAHTAWPRRSTDHAETINKRIGYETLTWGGTPIVSYGGRLCLENSTPEPVKELFSFMKKNRILLDELQENKFIGILSEQRISSITEDVKQSLTGAYKLLQSAGLQTGIVIKKVLAKADELAKYPVIFFPGAVSISPREAESIKQYVHDGGILIASGKASLEDNDFLLKDVFGVEFRGTENNQLESLHFWQGLWDIYLKSEHSNKLLPVKDICFVQKGESTNSLAHIVTGADHKEICSSIITSKFGKGSCCYINFPIEQIFEELEDSELVSIVKTIIKILVDENQPYRIDSVNRLYSSLKEKDNIKLLYMCNPCTETRNFTVSVQLNSDKSPRKLYSLTSKKEIDYKTENKKVIIEKHIFEDFDCIAAVF